MICIKLELEIVIIIYVLFYIMILSYKLRMDLNDREGNFFFVICNC